MRISYRLVTVIFIAVISGNPAFSADDIPRVEFNPHTAPFLQLLWARLGDLNGEIGAVESAEFSRDGKLIVSGGKYDNSLVVWRTIDGTVVWRRELDDEIERAGFSPDGRFVVSAGEDQSLQLWKVADGELVASIPLDAAVDGMAFSPDGRVLVTGKEGGVVQAWSFPDMELIRNIKLAGTINSVTFTRDGRYLALAGHPNKVWVLEADDFEIVHTLEGFPDVAAISVRIADDKGLIAAGQIGGYVSVWDLESGELVSRFNHTGYKVEAVCWTNDDNYLLAAGLNEYIRVVRTVDLGMENVPVAHLSPPAGRTEYLDFAPNGSSLVSAHEDGTVRLWLWKSGDLDINIKHHRALKERQRQAAEQRQADRAAKGIKSR